MSDKISKKEPYIELQEETTARVLLILLKEKAAEAQREMDAAKNESISDMIKRKEPAVALMELNKAFRSTLRAIAKFSKTLESAREKNAVEESHELELKLKLLESIIALARIIHD